MSVRIKDKYALGPVLVKIRRTYVEVWIHTHTRTHTHTPGSISRRLYTEVLVSHPPWWDLGFVFPCALSLFSKFPIMYIVLFLQCEKLLFFKLYK